MMGSVRRLDIDRVRAERLLQGEAAGGDVLRDVLAAAASPGNPVELTGEDAAVAAFRAARMFRDDRVVRDGAMTRGRDNARGPAMPHGASAGRGPSAVRTRGAHRQMAPRGFATHRRERGHSSADAARIQSRSVAKVFVVMAVLAVGVGGVGIAASTGAVQLPLPLHHAAPATNEGRAATWTSASTQPPATPSPSATTSAPRSSHGMCQAYLAAEQAGRPLTDDDPVFVRLVIAAGGASNVADYCHAVLSPSAHPSEDPPSNAHASKTHPAKPHSSKSHEPNSNAASANAGQGSGQSAQPDAPQAATPHANGSNASQRNVSTPGSAKSDQPKSHPANK